MRLDHHLTRPHVPLGNWTIRRDADQGHPHIKRLRHCRAVVERSGPRSGNRTGRQSRLQRHPERDVRRATLVEGHRDFQPQRIRCEHERSTS